MPRKPMMPQTRTLLLAWTALRSAVILAPSTVPCEAPVPACVCSPVRSARPSGARRVPVQRMQGSPRRLSWRRAPSAAARTDPGGKALAPGCRQTPQRSVSERSERAREPLLTGTRSLLSMAWQSAIAPPMGRAVIRSRCSRSMWWRTLPIAPMSMRCLWPWALQKARRLSELLTPVRLMLVMSAPQPMLVSGRGPVQIPSGR